VNGSFQPFDPSGLITSPDVAVTARSGQPILLRCLDSTYVPQVVVFRPEPNTGATLSPVLIASDGRPFRDRSGAFTPVPVARQSRGPSTVRPSTKGCPVFIISSAERYDVLLNTADDPAPPGVYPVEIEFRQWRHPHPPITQAPINAPFFVARTTITIT